MTPCRWVIPDVSKAFSAFIFTALSADPERENTKFLRNIIKVSPKDTASYSARLAFTY